MKQQKSKSDGEKPKIVFQFSHKEVLSQNTDRFLALFANSKLPRGESLKMMQGMLYIAVDGYDDDPRSLPEIPEVRQLFQKLYKEFPYWFYFLVEETLPTMALCLFDQYFGTRREATENVAHGFRKSEMADFVEEQAPPLQKMCLLAGMTLKDFDRLYYKLTVKVLPEVAGLVPPPC